MKISFFVKIDISLRIIIETIEEANETTVSSVYL